MSFFGHLGTTVKAHAKIAAFITAVILVVFAVIGWTTLYNEQNFPGFSRSEVRAIRKAIWNGPLSFKVWRGVSLDTVRSLPWLPQIWRIRGRSHIDDMRREPDGCVTVRYTMQFSKQTVTNLSVTVQKKNGAWIIKQERFNGF